MIVEEYIKQRIGTINPLVAFRKIFTKPFNNNGFYIKHWAGIGYTSKTSGTNILGSSEYDISPTLLFAAVHLGYTF